MPPELDGDVLEHATSDLPLEQVLEITGLTREQWDRLSPEEQVQRLQAGMKQRAGDGALASASGAEARFREQEPLLHGYVALSALALGREQEARAALQQALALDPQCAPALEAQKLLP